MRFPPTDLSQLVTFRIPESNHAVFIEMAFQIPIAGAICNCGHPATLHKQKRCVLNATCACSDYREALKTEDTRPFYQATFGPFESHALDRGLRVAKKLSISVDYYPKCSSTGCDNDGDGAVRLVKGKKYKQLSAVAQINEIHRIQCFDCLDRLVFDPIRDLPFDVF